jgi:PilZ domain
VKAAALVERRKHRRYIVRGRVRFLIDSLEVSADLVNFGQGGLLIRSPFTLPVGTRLDLRILAFCYPAAVIGIGRVVGGRGNLLAVQLVQQSSEADQLLWWLEQEHYPWTGTFDDHAVELRPQAWAEDPDSETAQEAGIEEIETEIFQQG